jgi:hypothetical protein
MTYVMQLTTLKYLLFVNDIKIYNAVNFPKDSSLLQSDIILHEIGALLNV